MRVLLLEDDRTFSRFAAGRLRKDGLVVDQAVALEEASRLLADTEYDCLILDRIVRGGDSIDLLRELRAAGNAVPVLVLSGERASTDNLLEGFDAGTDDYLPKPASLEELARRVEALCRRAGTIRGPVIVVRDLVVDSARRLVVRDGQTIDLTARELAILELLVSRGGAVVTQREIVQRCWTRENPCSNAVVVHVRALRKKLGLPDLIRTARGNGYAVDPDPDQAPVA